MAAQAKSVEDSKRREELQLHREKVGGIKRPAMWTTLVNRILEHLAIYENLHRPMGLELSSKRRPDGNLVEIRRTSFPCLGVRVSFLEARAIRADFRYRKSDESESVEWEETLGFRVDDLDNVQFLHKGEPLIDDAEAANIILRPIVDPMFKPPTE